MEPYHLAWLTAHPRRTVEWLKDKLRDGFDIHHLDGDHNNNDPNNLLLVECSDHLMLHGGRVSRLGPPRPKLNGSGKKTRRQRAKERHEEVVKKLREEFVVSAKRLAQSPNSPAIPLTDYLYSPDDLRHPDTWAAYLNTNAK